MTTLEKSLIPKSACPRYTRTSKDIVQRINCFLWPFCNERAKGRTLSCNRCSFFLRKQRPSIAKMSSPIKQRKQFLRCVYFSECLGYSDLRLEALEATGLDIEQYDLSCSFCPLAGKHLIPHKLSSTEEILHAINFDENEECSLQLGTNLGNGNRWVSKNGRKEI